MSINDYGWNQFFQTEWQKETRTGLLPGRVIADFGQKLRVMTEKGEISVDRRVGGIHESFQIGVGDWLVLGSDETDRVTVIRGVLPRRTKFSRAAAGQAVKEQIVAANMDYVFLIQSLNRDFNTRRLERYLIVAWESGAVPVVVLTKMDCCDDVVEKIARASETAPGVDVHAISALTGEGINGLRNYFKPGKTVALLGSSGVGKSTLVNTLAGQEILRTQEIREDDSRGRHTTTHREIILLPNGGMIMDTPGMRALGLWEADTGMEVMFGDIETLILNCRFSDCQHQNEPGCAVRGALLSGELDPKRWESWLKLQKELEYLEAKKDGKVRFQEKQWGKQVAKFQKQHQKGFK